MTVSSLPQQGENMLTINGKGSDSQLVSNLLDEIRAIV